MTIKLVCNDCQHYNRQNLGTADYEFRPYLFSSFSEAHQHMIEYPNHWIDFRIQNNEEEE